MLRRRRRRRAGHEQQVEATRDFLEALLDKPLSDEERKQVMWTLRNDRRVSRVAASAYEQFGEDLDNSDDPNKAAGLMDFFEWLIANQDSIFAFISKLISLFGGLSASSSRQLDIE